MRVFQGERLSKAHLLDLLMILPLAAIWAFLPNDGVSVFAHWFFRQMVTLLGDLPHSRALETEADEVGLHLAARVCAGVAASRSGGGGGGWVSVGGFMGCLVDGC